MKIVVVGLNHKTAPIQVRERLSFDATNGRAALEQLKAQHPQAEFALLSTCNRVELYSASDQDGWEDCAALVSFLCETRSIEPDELRDHLYIHVNGDAVRHMLKVASSLDSLVVGESQIVSQVKESYTLACNAKSVGKILNRLYHCAFSTSKEVHTSTAIAKGRVSVAGVAIELAQQLFADIKRAQALVIGAGQMGELLVQHLLHLGCRDITIVNRTFCKGKSMASEYGVAAARWDQLHEQLSKVDIVVGSAAVQDYLFDEKAFAPLVRQRQQKTLLVIDLAVPRNFDPAINELENVYLFSVDDLSEVAQQNQQVREHDIDVGLELIDENTNEFLEWLDVCDLGPQIGQLKMAFTQISQKELDRFFVGTREHAHCRDTLSPMVKRVANKILYCVIKHVNTAAKEQGTQEAAKIVQQIVKHAEQIAMEKKHTEEGSS
jgi:glutamyl-tRNA reductase